MRNSHGFKLRGVGLIVSAIALGSVLAGTATAQSNSHVSVMAGTDYFHTLPGTFFDFGNGIGIVPLIGNPIGPGDTDTIITRLDDVDLTPGTGSTVGSGTTDLQFKALSLKSANHINLGGSLFDVFVTLDPNPAPGQNKGWMTITGDSSGGTFTSYLDVLFDAKIQNIATGASTTITGEDIFTSAGYKWFPTFTPGTLLVDGPYGDLDANHHISGVPEGELDFFAPFIIEVTPKGEHIVEPAPEPGTVAFLAAGIVPAIGFLIRRRRAA